MSGWAGGCVVGLFFLFPPLFRKSEFRGAARTSDQIARWYEFLARKTKVRVKRKMMIAPIAARSGEKSHPSITLVTPVTNGNESLEEDQLTESKPLAAHEAPMMPPIVECVKETGNS